MKIRRIILVILIATTYFFLQDLRYFGPARRMKNRSSINFSISGSPALRQASKIGRLKREITFENKLRVNGIFGTTEIRQTSGNEVKVVYTISTFREEELKNFEVVEKVMGETLIYELEGPELAQNASVDFIMEIPEGIEVEVNQAFGDFKTTSFKGDLILNASHSDIEVEGLKGSLVLNNSFGGAILKRIEGPVTINDSYSDTYLDLVRVPEGYDFELELNYGELKRFPPFSTRTSARSTTGSGKTGQGKYPVILNSNFGTLEIKLDY